MSVSADSALLTVMRHLAAQRTMPAYCASLSVQLDDSPPSQAARKTLELAFGGARPAPPVDRQPSVVAPCRVTDRLWANDPDAALRLLQSGEPSAWPESVVVGVAALLRNQPARAWHCLSGAAEGEVGLHAAHAALQMGLPHFAWDLLQRIQEPDSYGRHLLEAWVGLERDVHSPRDFSAWWSRAIRSETLFGGVLRNDVPGLMGRAALEAVTSVRDARALLQRLLVDCAGNLGSAATLARLNSEGERVWIPADCKPPSRAMSSAALQRLRYAGEDVVRAELDGLVATWTDSAQPLCYRGELRLWQGDYAGALGDFIAARRREPARWSDIGIVAALTFLGHLRAAKLAGRYARWHYPPLAVGTLSAYLGVLAFEQGQFSQAKTILGQALEAKPTRLGSHLELWLAASQLGCAEQALASRDFVVRNAAPLLAAAADQALPGWTQRQDEPWLDPAVWRQARRMMRGNRSSSLWTWQTPAGNLQVLIPAERLQHQALSWLNAYGRPSMR